MRFLYILWLSFFWHLIFRILVWYSCQWEMRYMVGDRSSSKAVLLFGHVLRLFIVPAKRRQATASKLKEWMNTYYLFPLWWDVQVSRVIETTNNPTIKCPGKMPQQIELHVVTDDCQILWQYFARSSLRGFVDVKISYQNKILTHLIRCVSRPKTERYVTCFRLNIK